VPNFVNDSKNINQYTPIELYKFDFSTIVPRYFGALATDVKISNQRQSNGSDIVMNGTTFEFCAVSISGVASELGKVPSNPQLTIDRTTFDALSNVATLIANWTNLGNLPPFPFRGVTVERMLTLHDYASDINWGFEVGGTITAQKVFLSGVKSRYYVNNVLTANDKYYVLELAPSLGLDQRTDANRKMPTGLCSLRYRTYVNNQFEYTPVAEGGCPYGQQTNGDPGYDPVNNLFDRNNNPTTDNKLDYCNKSIRACRLRWAAGGVDSPSGNLAELPFMGQFRAGTPGTETNE
jgi:phage-related protein